MVFSNLEIRKIFIFWENYLDPSNSVKVSKRKMVITASLLIFNLYDKHTELSKNLSNSSIVFLDLCKCIHFKSIENQLDGIGGLLSSNGEFSGLC